MAITLGSTGIVFSDGTSRSTANVDTGGLISITSYTSGTNTYTVPAGCKTLFVRLVGGGGGSAGYCESGGAGGYAEKLITGVTAGQTITATVGAGGGGVGYYAAGGTGGTSSFGSYASATGGYGSNSNYSHTGGLGGVGSGGDITLQGGGGTGHANHHGYGGVAKGGASYYGGSFSIRHYHSTVIGPGAPGAGAPGGITDGNGTTGNSASNGLIVVYAYA